MKERLMRIYQAAKSMILADKDLTKDGRPELPVLRDKSGLKNITSKERDNAAKSVRDEQKTLEAEKSEKDAAAAAEPAQPGKTSYQIVIPNMRPINHRRLMSRFQNVFDEKDLIVPLSHGDGHIQIDFTGLVNPDEVKTTILAVLSGWGYPRPEELVR